MLQLIGWMGCVYLVVKGFEFIAHDGYQRPQGGMKSSATLAVLIAWLASGVLFFAFLMQGSSFPTSAYPSEAGDSGSEIVAPEAVKKWQPPVLSPARRKCVDAAKDAEEAVKCRDIP